MHWLLLLALLGSTTGLDGAGSSPASMNRLAEQALRRQIGTARQVSVQVAPGARGLSGDFDSLTVSLDGFSADRLVGLADRADSSDKNTNSYPSQTDDPGFDPGYDFVRPRAKNFDAQDIIDILGSGVGREKSGSGQIDWGTILGGALGRNKGVGRVGRIRLRATNFTFGGTRYDALSADLGEIRFDWSKALRGDFDVQSLTPGTLGLRVSNDAVTKLLAPRLPSLRDVKVRFSGGRALIGAKSDLYGLRVPFEVGAKLSVQDNEVRADSIRASVARFRLPSFVVDELTRGVNPLYDFDPQNRWPLAVNLSTASAEGNAMTLRGGVRWHGNR